MALPLAATRVGGHGTAGGNIKGEGVQKNYAIAITWYLKASVQGDAESQTNLGSMYGNGQGVPKNYVLAYMWWSLAAAQGNKTAAKNLEIVEKIMTPADVSRAQAMAAKWKPKKTK